MHSISAGGFCSAGRSLPLLLGVGEGVFVLWNRRWAVALCFNCAGGVLGRVKCAEEKVQAGRRTHRDLIVPKKPPRSSRQPSNCRLRVRLTTPLYRWLQLHQIGCECASSYCQLLGEFSTSLQTGTGSFVGARLP
jgi:hypothetical protein